MGLSLKSIGKFAGKVAGALNPLSFAGAKLVKGLAQGDSVGGALTGAGRNYLGNATNGAIGAGVLGAGYLAAPMVGSALGLGAGGAGAAGAGAAGGGGGIGVGSLLGGGIKSVGKWAMRNPDAILGAAGMVQGGLQQRDANRLNEQALGYARDDWDSRAPLREAGLQGLMQNQAPDLSHLSAGSSNPFTQAQPRRMLRTVGRGAR